jgi:hypothetical protein
MGHQPDDDDPGREPPKNSAWLQGEVGSKSSCLAAEIADIKDRKNLWDARLFAAQLDSLEETHNRLHGLVCGEVYPLESLPEENLDLACVFVLILEEEIEELYQAIEDLASHH